MSLRFGTDGIRGLANAELTPELALGLGRAAARRLPGSSFLLGADTRRSSPMLKAALAAGLAAEGRNVLDAGVLPTPALAWLAASRQVPAAMISASHNAFSDNGIKLLSAAGTKLADVLERAVEEELDVLLSTPSGPGRHDQLVGAAVGAIELDEDAASQYVEHLLSCIKLPAGATLSVICDCANGAASSIAPALFGRLGLDVEVIAASPNGTNINEACGSTHPELLAEAVLTRGADLGLCVDGDADRLIAVDGTGQVVDGDHLLAMFARDLKSRGELEQSAIVVTVMSNLGLRIALEAEGIDVVETPIGDRHVVDALEGRGLDLGGEQSGHIVFRRQATTGDGLLTGLKLIELVARTGRSLAELAASAMQRLPQELRNVPVGTPARLGEAAAVWREVEAVELDLAGSGRVLLRASGTEPTVRVMVEAGSHAVAVAAADRLVAVVRRELGVASG